MLVVSYERIQDVEYILAIKLGELGPAHETPELFVDWSMWMPIIPSRYSITKNPGFRRHQETRNAQFSTVGSCNGMSNSVD